MTPRNIPLAILLALGCGFPGSQFPTAPAEDAAECRNVARLVGNTCYHGEGLAVALVCRNQVANTFDDCMFAKGHRAELDDEQPARKRWSKP